MSTTLDRPAPDDIDVSRLVVVPSLVGATLYLIDGGATGAASVAAGIFVLELSTDVAEAVVGDYAGNAVFGLLLLAATGAFAVLGGASWLVAGFALCGCWLCLDGVQHLRHGVTRDEVGVPYRHEGRVLTGLPKALLARLVEPLSLSRRSR